MLEAEAELIAQIARQDPSFRNVPEDVLRASEVELMSAGSLDEFRLSAMRHMALAGNGHSRAIANHVAQVAPIRFLWLSGGPCVAAGPLTGARLTAVNGIMVDRLFGALRPLLAGTDQRAASLAGFMLAWGLAICFATGTNRDPEYVLETASGDDVRFKPDHLIRGDILYPVREPGPAAALIAGRGLASRIEAQTGIFLRMLRNRVHYVRIGDLATLSEQAVCGELAGILLNLADARHIIVDLRGNPGGNFFGAVDFTKRIRGIAPMAAVAVLVDRFTFSAAIVTAALLKVYADACLVGEEMGDRTSFFAEGDTIELQFSGIRLRYSDGWHDWLDGLPDPVLTPARIAAEHVAAGSMCPDIEVSTSVDDLLSNRDSVLEAACEHVSNSPDHSSSP